MTVGAVRERLMYIQHGKEGDEMTREEAIDELFWIREDENEPKGREALEMAIKALEAPPNDNWEGYSKRLWKSAYEYGKADAEQRWIPVSERLPKNDEDVLVCSSQGAMEVCYYHIDGTFYPTEYEDLNETGWYNEDDDLLGFEPIAWMPLPLPWKGE